MWTYVLGPFLAFLPEPWRRVAAPSDAVNWPRAGALSGLLESAIAILALAYWYSYSVTTWISRGLDAALTGRISATDHEIGFMALSLFATHPLTWTLGYFALEGAVRFCAAAFTGTALGTVLLVLPVRILAAPFRRVQHREFRESNLTSYVGAVRDSVLSSRGAELSDELCFGLEGEGQILEIRSSRAKNDWQPPRILRYEEEYFRLEDTRRALPPRPFVYRFRKLAAGVPGRTVIFYKPQNPVITAASTSRR